MDWLTFIASLVGSLAWPVVILVLLYLLRKQIGSLAERLQEITLPGGAKAVFVKQLDKARTQSEIVAQIEPIAHRDLKKSNVLVFDLANDFPEAAIIEAFKDVETALTEVRTHFDLPVRSNLSGVVSALVSRKLIDETVRDLFESLRRARNAAAHASDRDRITRGEAVDYVNLALSLARIFRGAVRRSPRKG